MMFNDLRFKIHLKTRANLCFLKNSIVFAKINIFLYVLNHFDTLISKISLK